MRRNPTSPSLGGSAKTYEKLAPNFNFVECKKDKGGDEKDEEEDLPSDEGEEPSEAEDSSSESDSSSSA